MQISFHSCSVCLVKFHVIFRTRQCDISLIVKERVPMESSGATFHRKHSTKVKQRSCFPSGCTTEGWIPLVSTICWVLGPRQCILIVSNEDVVIVLARLSKKNLNLTRPSDVKIRSLFLSSIR